jgi:DNA mismatch repair protein MutS2
MRVKVLSINQNGEVVSLPDSRNEVKVKIGIMKISVPASDIRTIIESKSQKKARQKVSSYGNIYRSKSLSVSPSVTVRGQILDDALMDVEKYLDDAYIAGLKNVTIIHGVGEGVLKDGIRIELKRNKHVKSARAGKYNEGGQGVTIVELKEN